jgi:hypothetical protein
VLRTIHNEMRAPAGDRRAVSAPSVVAADA